jgi:hypothetical protein
VRPEVPATSPMNDPPTVAGGLHVISKLKQRSD